MERIAPEPLVNGRTAGGEARGVTGFAMGGDFFSFTEWAQPEKTKAEIKNNKSTLIRAIKAKAFKKVNAAVFEGA